ncbi:histidine phosphatase family protein [Leptospira fluminis]|uniref:Histidine phosphatase family protein n=1 Tax=Leptospira fluminis TaxID=2484979 RepID=A0A4R9GT75_9LEPT|nr:alpha-ribazole phosphatase family protein [Leptospira fluminis]TGK21025.1 histidine phosphatase family protein [Leptospira fluminis]
MEILLIRHTTPEVEPGTCYGWTDLGLPSTFEKEAGELAKILPGRVNSIRTSPLFRCYSLAEFLSKRWEAIGKPPAWKVDPRIRELNFGAWEGKLWEEIPRQETDHWMENYVHRSPPDGETYSDLRDRVSEAWEETLKEGHTWEKIRKEEGENEEYREAWVSHGGVIRCIASFVLGFPLENAFRASLEYGSLSMIRVRFGESASYPQFVFWNRRAG